MGTLLFRRPDDAFNHAVLLRATRRVNSCRTLVAAERRRVATTSKNEPVVRAKQERCRYPAQCAKSSNQRVPRGATGGGRLPAGRQMPAQQFARMTVDHQRQRGPAITSRPDPAQICGPTCSRGCNTDPLGKAV